MTLDFLTELLKLTEKAPSAMMSQSLTDELEKAGVKVTSAEQDTIEFELHNEEFVLELNPRGHELFVQGSRQPISVEAGLFSAQDVLDATKVVTDAWLTKHDQHRNAR